MIPGQSEQLVGTTSSVTSPGLPCSARPALKFRIWTWMILMDPPSSGWSLGWWISGLQHLLQDTPKPHTQLLWPSLSPGFKPSQAQTLQGRFRPRAKGKFLRKCCQLGRGANQTLRSTAPNSCPEDERGRNSTPVLNPGLSAFFFSIIF